MPPTTACATIPTNCSPDRITSDRRRGRENQVARIVSPTTVISTKLSSRLPNSM